MIRLNEQKKQRLAERIRVVDNPLAEAKFEELFTNPDLYLCGRPVKQVLENRFFDCLNHHVRCGMCYPQSALAMFMLHDDPTARLVQGWARGLREDKVVRHAWVECQRDGAWYVIDLSWIPLELVPIPRDWYCSGKIVEAEPLWICNSQGFWQESFNQQNYELCQSPQTSWILPQLLNSYRPNPDQGSEPKVGLWPLPDNSVLRNDARYGKVMVPQIFRHTLDGGLISREVVDELMCPGLVKISEETRRTVQEQYAKLCTKVGFPEILY